MLTRASDPVGSPMKNRPEARGQTMDNMRRSWKRPQGRPRTLVWEHLSCRRSWECLWGGTSSFLYSLNWPETRSCRPSDEKQRASGNQNKFVFMIKKRIRWVPQTCGSWSRFTSSPSQSRPYRLSPAAATPASEWSWSKENPPGARWAFIVRV